MLMLVDILIPIFLLILLGYFLKVIQFPHRDFWNSLDKFNYYILFPSLLIYKLSTADLHAIYSFDYVFISGFSILIVSLVLIVLNKIIRYKNDAFTSIYQGAIRFNTYVFLALTDAFFGDKGIVIAAFLIIFMIPLLNILAIGVFSFYMSNAKLTILSLFKSIVKNPLIVSCVIGGGMNYIGISFPSLVENSLLLLTSAALPLGLLSVGVGLVFTNIIEVKSELFLSSIIKLVFLPIVIFILGSYFNVSNMNLAIIVIFAAMPTATSSYILAKQLGGDARLMSSIISIQTIISIFTISVLLQFVHL